ncbi:MAG TPA: hypothetical protein VGO11_12365, partial [Chthoniobacteraceae bacterium]|nr:hypothetical protein [Chthoniobacteraceae bacterium]
ATASWNLVGKIIGGTVRSDNGAKLFASPSGGTLDGVTMDADLELTSAGLSGHVANILHGLTLTGTATIGYNSFLNFVDSQTLGGTGSVVFENNGASGLVLTSSTTAAPTLTIGSGMTIRGGAFAANGANIGDSDSLGSISGGTIINDGKISADVSGAMLFLNRVAVVNHGTIEAKNGGIINIGNLSTNSGTISATGSGRLTIDGSHWTNTGTLGEADSFLFLQGTFTAAGLGATSLSGGNVYLAGTLENTGATFTIPAAGTWRLAGGTILGGTVSGSKLQVGGGVGIGTLDGVTMNADLDLATDGGNYLHIYHGLTLNGVATIGGSILKFHGTQTLGGTGSVQFLDHSDGTLQLTDSGSILTIGPSMTIHGGSAQPFGARIGYNENEGGPTDVTVINQGKISADVSGTSITILQRFINVGALEEHNGGTIVAPNKIDAVLKTLTKTSAPYAFLDADGTPVKVKWLGAGSVTLVRTVDSNSHGDLLSISTTGSNLTSSLSITTTGVGATTSVESIDIHGSLGSLTAATTNLAGNLSSTNSVRALTLKGVSDSTIHLGPRAAGDTKTTTSLTFDLVANLQIDSATPLLALTAAQWLDRDGTPDVIKAPSLGTLTIKSLPARALASDFEAGLNLSGAGVAAKGLTLGKAVIAGKIAGSDWQVAGNVGTITAGSTAANWSTHFNGSLVSLTTTGSTGGDLHIGARALGDTTTATKFALGSAAELSIHSATPILTITATQWLDRDATADVLAAPSIGALTIKGNANHTIAGDFEADVALTSAAISTTKPMLGLASVAGQITGGTWSVAGRTGQVKAGAFASDWVATFSLPIGNLTTAKNASGDITIGARPAGDLSRTSLSFDTASDLSIHSLTPISSLTTRSWLDLDATADVLSAPSLDFLTVKTGDFAADLTLSGAGVPAAVKTLGTVSVKGKIDNATWSVTGLTGTLGTGATGTDWTATFTKSINSLTATTLSGTLQAASIGNLQAGNIDHLSLTLTQPVSPTIQALHSLTVKNAIDHSDILAAGNIGTVSVAKFLNSRLYAGVASGVTGLPQSTSDFASAAVIAKLVVSGTLDRSPAMSNSYVAASQITSAYVALFAPNNLGQPYGLAADSIATLILRTANSTTTQTNLTAPTADASAPGDFFFVRIL